MEGCKGPSSQRALDYFTEINPQRVIIHLHQHTGGGDQYKRIHICQVSYASSEQPAYNMSEATYVRQKPPKGVTDQM